MTNEIVRQDILRYQRNEITEHHIYKRLAGVVKSEENRLVLERIADDEKRHYDLWKKHTGEDVEPDQFKVSRYFWMCRILGLTFSIKLMERGEGGAQHNYRAIAEAIPEAEGIADDENRHEHELIEMLDEERLQYTGSVVLGLNDALVELTGALAGFTLALQNTKLIALTGSITGIAAALSMAASEYLSTRSEKTDKHPLKASLYTGSAYIMTVILLISPYLLLKNYFLCLGLALFFALLIIAVFNYYISVAKDESFRHRFLEMAGLSFGVAAFSFVIGYALRAWAGIEI